MIGGIKLILPDHLRQMWKFKRCHTLRFKQDGKCSNEIIDIGYMGQYVVGHDQVGLVLFRFQFQS